MNHSGSVFKGFIVVAVVCLLIVWWASKDQAVFGDKNNSASTSVTVESQNDESSPLNKLSSDDLKAFQVQPMGL